MGIVKFRYCPSCNSLFDCYCESERACWCDEYKLSVDVLEELSKTYNGCLCPVCLSKFATKNATEPQSNQ